MKIFLITIVLSIVSIGICIPQNAFAQVTDLNAQGSASVSAQVGSHLTYLNISGYISPYASIDLLINNFPIRNVVADENGNFSFTAVQIQTGLSQLCFDAHDFQRIGESYSCISLTPSVSDVTINNIFLPPTSALKSTQINIGQYEEVVGYSMPFATITIHLNNSQTFSAIADKTGFYSYKIGNLIAGDYQLFVAAVYKNTDSIKPLKFLSFTALSLPQTITTSATTSLYQAENNFIQPFINSPLGPLWAAIPLGVIISFLLASAYPGLIAKLLSPLAFSFLKRKDKRLHHYWFIGY